MTDFNSHPKVTIADVARESGVSPATVSLVLRDKPGVSEETRQRVLEKAGLLGYLFQPSNQAAQRSAINSIGLLVKVRPNDLAATNSFYASVLAGIEEFCRRRQIYLVYANLPVDEHNVAIETPRLVTEQDVDGLLLVGMQLDATAMEFWQRQSTPLVLVDAYAEGDPYDAVVTDNRAGAVEATNHLIHQGHREIVLVGSEPDAYPSILERRTGYIQAMKSAGLQPRFVDSPLWGETAAPLALEYLRKHPQVTAVLTANDAVAIVLMQAMQRAGYSIPGDLSVVGFDNIASARLVTPPLTTMRVDKMGMGRIAAQMLANRIEYPESGRVRTLIRPHLIERESTSPPKQR
jgi:LacI family transcriptional regulator